MRVRYAIAALLVALLAVAVPLTGRTGGQHDEAAPTPGRSDTAIPSIVPGTPGAAPLPGRVPVGSAGIPRTAPVWAEGSELHVGTRGVDVSPRRIDALVSTPGGVYFLDDDELWFTDLTLVRAAGIAGVTELGTDASGSLLLVETAAGGPTRSLAYETMEGFAVPAASVTPASARDRLGTPGTITLRSERSDVSPTTGPVATRMGTGRFGLVDLEGPLVAFDTTGDLRVPLTGVVGTAFELVSWTGPATFYGLATDRGRSSAVLGCDLETRRCTVAGRVDPDGSLLFESGA